MMEQTLHLRLLIYALITYAVVMTYLYLSIIVQVGLTNHALGADYTGFLLGSAMLAQGHGEAYALYSLSVQTEVQTHLLMGSTVRFNDNLLPFVNPVYVAMLATPLYYLPPALGFVLWDGVQAIMLLWAVWLLQPLVPRGYRVLLWLGGLAYLPLYQSMVEGQISPMLLLGIALVWRSLRQPSAEGWAGASLVLLLLKPQLLPPYLLYLLYRRRWQALVSFTAISGVVYLAAALVSGWNWPFTYINLLNYLSSHPNRYGSLPQVMLNWRGLLVRQQLDSSALLLTLTVLTLAALVFAWWWADRRSTTRNLALDLAAATIAAALTSFYLYPHDLTILIFPGAVLLGWAAEHNWPLLLVAMLGVGFAGPLLLFYTSGWVDVYVAVMVGVLIAALYLRDTASLAMATTLEAPQ